MHYVIGFKCQTTLNVYVKMKILMILKQKKKILKLIGL